MLLQHMSISRIIIHQIYRLEPDGVRIPPTQNHEFTNFAPEALETFKARVISALGYDSKAVEMEIVNQENDGLPSIINDMINQENDDFAVSSYDIAKKLANAQQTKSIPGGIVVVFDGEQGPDRNHFLGIIKAEVHSGYEKVKDPETKEISLKFVEELLLTPGTRLYKTAGFFKKSMPGNPSNNLNDNWAVMVSDNQFSKVDGKTAAHYFYSDFLGCGYPQTSARTTKQFYDASKLFIENLDVSLTRKIELYNALTAYLKLETAPTISAVTFAERYFDTDTQDAFTAHIRREGLPGTAFTKDLEHIKSKLRMRKIRFNSNIKIIAPSDTFTELVEISPIEGDTDEFGRSTEWTKVIIKDRISDQE